jgi:hypothetical protein
LHGRPANAHLPVPDTGADAHCDSNPDAHCDSNPDAHADPDRRSGWRRRPWGIGIDDGDYRHCHS